MYMRKGLLFATLCATTLFSVAGCKPPSFHATVYDPAGPAPAVSLVRANGSRFSLSDERGSVVLLFFGYTHCPDVCPTTLADWKRMKISLGRDASRVRFVFISVDPSRDDPATVQNYVSRFDPGFIGVTGDSATIAGIESAFHVSSARVASSSANGYAMSHSARTFVVDKRGDLRLLYSFGLPTDGIVSDIRQLLRGA